MERKKLIGLILGPALFLLTLMFIDPAQAGFSPQAQAVLACALWVVVWWVTEAIPIPATSLLPIVLFPLTGALEIKLVTVSYAKPMIFLFLGGFILALAMERWNLHRRIALSIIAAIGTNARLIVLGFMVATGFLSMWISNTATTMMMLPIAMAIITQFNAFLKASPHLSDSQLRNREHFGRALLLSIAYSASIGGMATLIGTPTNLIFAGFAKEFYDVDISFSQWLRIGLPIAVVLMGISWLHMVRIAFPLSTEPIPGGRAEIQGQLKQLGAMSREEKTVLIVFSVVAILWMTRKPLSRLCDPWLNGLDDNIIALLGALSLFLLPAREKGKKIMDWPTAHKLPWGILLLFGGGFAVAAGFQNSGLAAWIAQQLVAMQGIHLLLFVLMITALVNYLTELTMNVATCTMILPVLASLALATGLHPLGLMVAATIAASCAFMLPVATAPNAIVFGSGYLAMKDMVRAGFGLNMISILIITLFVYFTLGSLWDINLHSFPLEWME
jgi:sodium-dependent dicarboxylate transporter 2/3/5